MKTKKTVALVLAALLVLALFAGCSKSSGGGETPATQAPSAQTQKPSAQTQAPSAQTQAPAEEDEGPYHFAKGYATDADGWPLEKWVYDRPIADDDTHLHPVVHLLHASVSARRRHEFHRDLAEGGRVDRRPYRV